MVSDAEGQAAATASMDQSAFAHMEKMLRDETKGEYTVGKMLGVNKGTTRSLFRAWRKARR